MWDPANCKTARLQSLNNSTFPPGCVFVRPGKTRSPPSDDSRRSGTQITGRGRPVMENRFPSSSHQFMRWYQSLRHRLKRGGDPWFNRPTQEGTSPRPRLASPSDRFENPVRAREASLGKVISAVFQQLKSRRDGWLFLTMQFMN